MAPPRPRIYADFHGTIASPRTPGRDAVVLSCWGTLRDLSFLGIRLREGLALTIHDASDEAEDLEAPAVAYYDPAGRYWYAELEREIAYVPAGDRARRSFVCLGCREALDDTVRSTGACPHCGLEIRAAIAPP